MDALYGQASEPLQSFSNIPFNQRWEYLKPVIKNYYVDQRRKLGDVVIIMKESHNFDASERQYKHHFKKWNFGKIIPASVKEDAIQTLGKRSRDTTSTPLVEYNGEEIHKAKLQRYMTALARQDNALQLSNNIFIHWNLPYKALKASMMSSNDTASPFGGPVATPNYISIASPGVLQSVTSPRGIQSPMDAPTPTMLAIRNKQIDDRAKLLIQGRHDELLNSMNKSERRTATTWLYHFWLFSYKTAKHWGRGPQDWSASVLRFTDFQDQRTTANTPQAFYGTPLNIYDPNDDLWRDHIPTRDPSEPPRLCFWSIHALDDLEYERDVPSSPPEPIEDFEAIDEDEWPDWPEDREYFTFIDKLQAALKTNSFSNLDISDIPLSLSQIAQSAEASPDQLLLEALGFAIMARNEELLWELLDDVEFLDISTLSPFHLAATYLGGAKTCCNVLDFVVKNFAAPNITQQLCVNSFGHTVLDTLMMGILKSHTSCLPVVVDARFSKDKRFVGEDVDVCGRWDADSPCIRKLLAEGKLAIPPEWKHIFCHTSTQAVCHSIGTLFGTRFAPDINTPSGLFKRQCNCGRQLLLYPLHCLVMIAFHLAQSGRPGENLFGILACLVCLLVNGTNPLLKAHASMDMLMDRNIIDKCSHSNLDPPQFAEQIPEDLTLQWTDEVRLGWSAFCKVLRLAQEERRKEYRQALEKRDSRAGQFRNNNYDPMVGEDYAGNEFGQIFEEDENDEEEEEIWCSHHKIHENFYDGSREIGLLWAAIQTELLTYRKIEEDDAWISNNFDISALIGGIENGSGVSLLPLIDKEMMKPVCRCGRFREAEDEACVMVQEASAWYFSNTDVWKRAAYIVVPEYRSELWYRH